MNHERQRVFSTPFEAILTWVLLTIPVVISAVVFFLVLSWIMGFFLV